MTTHTRADVYTRVAAAILRHSRTALTVET